MEKVRYIQFEKHVDYDGMLSVAESQRNIPFEIKRVFWIENVTKNGIRGNHASKNCEFVYICIRGSVEIEIDDGVGKNNYQLSYDNPNGLYLSPDVWMKVFHFSDEAILLVLASKTYAENCYYESYDEFCKGVI